MQLSYTMKQGTSKQEWLANVQMCPCCHGQHPKSEFKRIDGIDMCKECQEEYAEVAAH